MCMTIVQRSTIISYFKVGYLLHIMTLMELILLVLLYRFSGIADWIHTGWVTLKSSLLYPFFLAPLFPQLDAYSRFQNYKQIKDYLYQYGFQARILKPFVHSRCQRDASMAAAEELGFSIECRTFYKGLGYKWYHLLPDFLFTEPSILISKAFWFNTFFVKYYSPRFNYTMLISNTSDKTDFPVLQDSISV